MLIELDGKRPKIGSNVYLAPTAVLIGDVEVGDNTSIWFGAVLRGDMGPIRVGAGCSIQDNTTLHVFSDSPTVLHDDVTVGHNSVLEGCELGRGCLVGMNSTVLPFAKLGEYSMLAAGSVVPEGMHGPDKVLLGGTPARVLKELSGPAAKWVERAASEYQQLKDKYISQGLAMK